MAGLTYSAAAMDAAFRWRSPKGYVLAGFGKDAPVVAAFVTTVPKIGAFAALYRFAAEALPPSVDAWPLLIAVIVAAIMTLGNLAAFAQSNVRRLLAYSTISQAGYLLLPGAVAGRTDLAEPALLFYLAAYAVTDLGAFAVVIAAGHDDLDSCRAMAGRSRLLAISLLGTPPTAVFVGKLLMFGAALDGDNAWPAVVAAVMIREQASLSQAHNIAGGEPGVGRLGPGAAVTHQRQRPPRGAWSAPVPFLAARGRVRRGSH
ncbi:proton-conducting transporter membrane subunit [Spirillospora sp. CA-142024]|uniref:proton-conducting transporter transmembrane domain-containing protein n=1 Tax=Spirillospora sp. CA-142024 TaxID=3240036 RepID=UPI003D8FCCD4